MIQNLFVHTITIVRFLKIGHSTLGSPSYSSSSYSFSSGSSPSITEIPCRVEEYTERVQYRESNDREVNSTLVYVNPQFIILPKDRIYWGSKHVAGVNEGDYIGVVDGVNPAMKGSTTTLDHWEITIENP